MPVIRRANIQADETNPDFKRLMLVNADAGAGYLEMGELTIVPGGQVPLHIHPTHEEGMYIIDGPLDYVLGDESGSVDTGDVLLAPAGVKHRVYNSGPEPRRLMFIFPTTNVQRRYL